MGGIRACLAGVYGHASRMRLPDEMVEIKDHLHWSWIAELAPQVAFDFVLRAKVHTLKHLRSQDNRAACLHALEVCTIAVVQTGVYRTGGIFLVLHAEDLFSRRVGVCVWFVAGNAGLGMSGIRTSSVVR